jgi:uncharacterized RDD family membrane protein YckC
VTPPDLTHPASSGLRVVSEGEEASPYPKCSLLLRGMARLTDVAIAGGLYRFGGRAGTVVALLFLLLADGMLQGQSPGKRIFGVKVVHLPTRMAARYRESMLRNAPFGLCVLFSMMPQIGAVAFAVGTAVIGMIESWKVLRDPLGLRLGDAWAFTQVIDGKVVAGARAIAPPGEAVRAQGQLRSLPRSAGRAEGRGNR